MSGIPQIDGRLPEISRQSRQAVIGDLYLSNQAIVAGGVNLTGLTTFTPSANVIIAAPFYAGRDSMMVRMDAEVNVTQASQNYRVGIYSNKKVGIDYPDILLFDSGSITTGSGGFSNALCQVSLRRGDIYWFVHLTSSTTAAFRSLPVGAAYPILGIDSSMGTALGVGWSLSYTYGALPNTFPEGATVHTTTLPLLIGWLGK